MDSLADLYRLLNNLLRLGTVAEVAGDRCRIRSGDVVTDFLPWFVAAAGADSEWAAPSIGEQVVVLSPGGDLSGGMVLRGLYSDHRPAPDRDPNRHVRRYPDGALLVYDAGHHALTAVLPSGGTVTVTAEGGMTIHGPLHVDGDVTISGAATASADVVAAGISLKEHVHSGVQPGGGQSGPPA